MNLAIFDCTLVYYHVIYQLQENSIYVKQQHLILELQHFYDLAIKYRKL